MRWWRAVIVVCCASALGAACGGAASEDSFDGAIGGRAETGPGGSPTGGVSGTAGAGGYALAGNGGEPADAAGGDALDGSTPKLVRCGTATCATPSEVCCPHIDGGVCAPADTAPQNCEPIACDEAADCPAGFVCCFVGHHGCSLGSTCAASCDAVGAIQLCSSDVECATGACTPRSCNEGVSYGTCQTGYCCS